MNIKSGKWCLLTYRKQVSVLGVEPNYENNGISYIGHLNVNSLKGNGLTSIGNDEAHRPIVDSHTIIGYIG